ncbi:protein of unknown function [Duganella sp. CF517]|uniref:DUF4124 domain-containing protein n=1 Tax=Duganella sp. CF517 TaxID=1881038 RepID=UPI0008D0CEBB|nr:DUF4124 domain-containing protein [Duganella sp. CF517]SEN10419.1 protein of unknown function [Duganella sp. CF517]
MDHFRSTRRARPPLAQSVLLLALLALLALGLPRAALAQYIWIDDKGVKQLSDRPPPPSVPAKRILKAPGKVPFNPNAAPLDVDEPPAAVPSADAGAKPAPTLAQRNEAFNKRRADAEAAERKSAEEARQKADTAANCEAARQNQRALEQGMRMVNVDKNGERAIMTDAERAELGKKNQKVLAGCQ